MNFAVIGTNFITDRLIAAGMNVPGFRLQAVYSRTMERAREFAAKYDIPDTYDSLEALARAENIDIVYVASPTVCHAEQSIMMLKAGKHVLCEKPVASTAEETRAMIAAACENNVILLEAMRSVFGPEFRAVQELLPELGKIRRASFRYCQYSSRYDHFKDGIIENAFRPELSNGALMDIGIYTVHALVKLFGKPDEVKAMAEILPGSIDGSGTILAHYKERGMLAELIYSKITDSFVPSEIQGEDAVLEIDKVSDIRRLVLHDRRTKSAREIPIEREKDNMFYEVEEIIRLAEMMRDGKTNEALQAAVEHNRYSLYSMEIADEARKQTGYEFK